MERQQLSKVDQHKESSDPGGARASEHASLQPIHQLRGALGNRAFGRFIQTKLEVSQPGDAHEQEADRVADAVMAGNSSPIGNVSQGVQRKLYRAELRPEDLVDSVLPPAGEAGPEAAETNPTEEVQRSATGETSGASPHFEDSLQQARNGGHALPPSTRSFMESRFGWDFSSVRVHSDARAHTLAREVNARAFTLDDDIFFSGSEYQPNSTEGQHLLAHELTHVVQQSQGRVSRQIQRTTSCSSFSGYQVPNALNTYNCAGLATRTYLDIFPSSAATTAIVANFNSPRTPGGGACRAGDVKFWLWEYQMHGEDDLGTVLSTDKPDFHIVAGIVDPLGADPSDVYSKNGHRPVYGPGTGPSFRPATRERSTSNDASETPATFNGRPVFKVRSAMTESITCAGCAP